MKNLILAASLFFALGISFSSCSDDETTTGTSSYLVGGWVVTEVIADGRIYNQNSKPFPYEPIYQIFDSQFQLNGDKSYSESQTVVTETNGWYRHLYENAGRWSFSADSVLTLTDNAGGPAFTGFYNTADTIPSISGKVSNLTRDNSFTRGSFTYTIPASDYNPNIVMKLLKAY